MRQMLLPSKRTIFLLLYLLISGFALNFFMQLASLNMDFASVLNWISKYYLLYLFGSLFFFFTLLVCASILPNVYSGALIALIIMIVIGIADYKKLATTGEPLFPWDLLQIKNAQEMGRITKGMISPLAIVLTVVIIAALVFLMIKLPKVKIQWPLRAVFTIVSCVMIFGFVNLVSNPPKLASSIHYQNIFWNQKVNYTQNGFLFAFTGNLKQKLIEKPDGYSKDRIAEIAKKYASLPDSTAAKATVDKPNIVYIMDEAFFDPTRLTSYKFSEDPLKFIHSAEKSTPAGFLLSPEFGGNTANVEFEALTGQSMYFMKDGSIPFQQKLTKISFLPSIVSILKDRGYQTLALHPFDKTFYNRNRVYPMLGFDRFTGEKDMTSPGRMTPDGYVSDKSAFQELIRELKQSGDQPTFFHLVTMQNHFPFTKGPNGPNTVTVEGVKPEYKDELETYVQDTKLTDEALQYLSEQLKTIQRPTIVAFWGDHLPALAAGIYAGTGFDSNPQLKHETKLLYLANFDIGRTPVGTMSPAFIGPTIFELSGQPMPTYYKLLAKVKSEIQGLSKNVLTNSGGVMKKEELTSAQLELLKDYELVQYDMIAGENYSKDLMF